MTFSFYFFSTFFVPPANYFRFSLFRSTNFFLSFFTVFSSIFYNPFQIYWVSLSTLSGTNHSGTAKLKVERAQYRFFSTLSNFITSKTTNCYRQVCLRFKYYYVHWKSTMGTKNVCCFIPTIRLLNLYSTANASW